MTCEGVGIIEARGLVSAMCLRFKAVARHYLATNTIEIRLKHGC